MKPTAEPEGLSADRFWLVLHEPGCVPERKGPWPLTMAAQTLREFIKARPKAYIDFLTIGHDGPDVEHGPEVLQMLDGRSMSVGRAHNQRTREAHAEHHAALAVGRSPSPEGVTEADIRWLKGMADSNSGHCGEGTFERKGRWAWNQRIERLVAALSRPAVGGGDQERLPAIQPTPIAPPDKPDSPPS